jgi:hypothetical protein
MNILKKNFFILIFFGFLTQNLFASFEENLFETQTRFEEIGQYYRQSIRPNIYNILNIIWVGRCLHSRDQNSEYSSFALFYQTNDAKAPFKAITVLNLDKTKPDYYKNFSRNQILDYIQKNNIKSNPVLFTKSELMVYHTDSVKNHEYFRDFSNNLISEMPSPTITWRCYYYIKK